MAHSLKLVAVSALVGVVLIGCSGESGEESGIEYALIETFDETRAGARLILDYDAASNSFIGRIENTTPGTLTSVRVEVHLSNGVELGPTTPTDLASGETLDVRLAATDQPFETFSAHPEVGGSGADDGGEHDDESSEEGGETGEEGGEHDG